MSKIKSFFKHKFVIVALCIFLSGIAMFGILQVIPRAVSYTSLVEMTVMDQEFEMKVKFKGGKLVTTNKIGDGEETVVSEQDYEIKDGVLYVEGDRWGEIDVYGIHMKSGIIFNGKAADTGYECKPAKISRIVSFGLIALGGLMLGLAVYVGVTKKPKASKATSATPEQQ